MKIDKIQKYITPKTTGYTAATAMGLSVLSGITKNKNMKKIHKPFAWISVISTILHIGLIEFYNYKFKHK